MEKFDEIALSHAVKEIEANLCFCILGKNSKTQNGRHMWEEEIFLWKTQNGRHMWEEEIFLKIAKSTLLRYPVGRKL